VKNTEKVLLKQKDKRIKALISASYLGVSFPKILP